MWILPFPIFKPWYWFESISYYVNVKMTIFTLWFYSWQLGSTLRPLGRVKILWTELEHMCLTFMTATISLLLDWVRIYNNLNFLGGWVGQGMEWGSEKVNYNLRLKEDFEKCFLWFLEKVIFPKFEKNKLIWKIFFNTFKPMNHFNNMVVAMPWGTAMEVMGKKRENVFLHNKHKVLNYDILVTIVFYTILVALLLLSQDTCCSY